MSGYHKHSDDFMTREARLQRIDKLLEWKLEHDLGRLEPDDPQNEAELADSLNISPKTLSEYKRDDYYLQQWRQRAMSPGRAVDYRELAVAELLQMGLSKNTASTAKVQALKTVIQATEFFLPKEKETVDEDPEMAALSARMNLSLIHI